MCNYILISSNFIFRLATSLPSLRSLTPKVCSLGFKESGPMPVAPLSPTKLLVSNAVNSTRVFTSRLSTCVRVRRGSCFGGSRVSIILLEVLVMMKLFGPTNKEKYKLKQKKTGENEAQ